MIRKITILITLFIVTFGGLSAIAHSGRTNKDGCHTDKKTGKYHCH